MRFPAPFVDEAWGASRAWAFIHTNRAFGPLDIGVFDRFEGYWVFFPWLPAFIQSLALRLSAAPALFPVRMESLVIGLVLLGAIYAIANRLAGWKFGLISAFLVSLSWAFLYSAHLARVDIIAAAFGFVAIALYLNSQPSRWWMGLLSGLCVGLAFEIHPHSVVHGLAILALYFLHWRWAMFRLCHFWSFVAGGVIGLVFYAALHVLPYPQTYISLNRLAFGPTHIPPLLTLDLSIIIRAISDAAHLLFQMYPLLIPVIVYAIVVLVRKRSESARTLLVLCGVLVVSSALLIRNKGHYYAILFTPSIDLVVAALVLEVGQQPWKGLLGDYLRRGLVWAVCIVTIILNLSLLRYNFGEVYRVVQNRVNQVVQPGDSIMAPQIYWFGLYDHVYYSWETLVYYQRYVPGSTLEDALREFRPDILIIDAGWDYFISDQPGNSPYLQHLRLSRTEMETFLNSHAHLVDEFDGVCYGQVRVYRIAWDAEFPILPTR
jgi:hypothetical protein